MDFWTFPFFQPFPSPLDFSDMMENSLVRTCLYLQAVRAHGPEWVKPSPAILDLTLIPCCLFFSWNHFFWPRQRSDWQRPRQRTFWILQTCLHSWPLNPLLPSAVSTFSLFRFSLLMHQLKLLRALHEPSKLHPSLSLVFPNTNLTWYGNFSKFTFVVCHCFYLLYIMIKKWKVHNLLDLNIKKTILSLYCSIEFYTVIKNNGFIAFSL